MRSAALPEVSMKKTCAACGGELFQFTPPASIKGVCASLLPTACRRCGQICLEGTPLALPEALERSVAAIAEEAARQGQLACAELVTHPNSRVEKYFDHVYRTGFVHGFLRALAWFTHQVKEGRLKRLRRLWREAVRRQESGSVDVQMTAAAFAEFDHLMQMDVAEEAHGSHRSNAGRAG
jgi:hypothetical protein